MNSENESWSTTVERTQEKIALVFPCASSETLCPQKRMV